MKEYIISLLSCTSGFDTESDTLFDKKEQKKAIGCHAMSISKVAFRHEPKKRIKTGPFVWSRNRNEYFFWSWIPCNVIRSLNNSSSALWRTRPACYPSWIAIHLLCLCKLGHVVINGLHFINEPFLFFPFYRTDASGPKGKGFKLIITAYSEGKWQIH